MPTRTKSTRRVMVDLDELLRVVERAADYAERMERIFGKGRCVNPWAPSARSALRHGRRAKVSALYVGYALDSTSAPLVGVEPDALVIVETDGNVTS